MHLVMWQRKFVIEMSKSLATNVSLCSRHECYLLPIFATFSRSDPLQIWRCIWLWKLDTFVVGDNRGTLSSLHVFQAMYKQTSTQPQYSSCHGVRGAFGLHSPNLFLSDSYVPLLTLSLPPPPTKNQIRKLVKLTIQQIFHKFCLCVLVINNYSNLEWTNYFTWETLWMCIFSDY